MQVMGQHKAADRGAMKASQRIPEFLVQPRALAFDPSAVVLIIANEQLRRLSAAPPTAAPPPKAMHGEAAGLKRPRVRLPRPCAQWRGPGRQRAARISAKAPVHLAEGGYNRLATALRSVGGAISPCA
jgi:hypothetical protein